MHSILLEFANRQGLFTAAFLFLSKMGLTSLHDSYGSKSFLLKWVEILLSLPGILSHSRNVSMTLHLTLNSIPFITFYYTTQAVRGPITKINQSLSIGPGIVPNDPALVSLQSLLSSVV